MNDDECKYFSTLIRKINYIGYYRGLRENEQIFREFLQKDLSKYSLKDLENFVDFLNLDDIYIYNILSGKESFPKNYDSELTSDLRNSLENFSVK